MARYSMISPDQFNEQYGPGVDGLWEVTDFTVPTNEQRSILGISESGMKLVVASLLSIDRELLEVSEKDIANILSRSGHGYYPDRIVTDFSLSGLAYVRLSNSGMHHEAELAACGNSQRISTTIAGTDEPASLTGDTNIHWSTRSSLNDVNSIRIGKNDEDDGEIYVGLETSE